MDDLLTALLLSHEIAHASQFIESLNGGNLSCVDKEIQAFYLQFAFIGALNEGEVDSLIARILANSKHPQIQQVNLLLSFSGIAGRSCMVNGQLDAECYQNTVKYLIQGKLIYGNPGYQKQCGL